MSQLSKVTECTVSINLDDVVISFSLNTFDSVCFKKFLEPSHMMEDDKHEHRTPVTLIVTIETGYQFCLFGLERVSL